MLPRHLVILVAIFVGKGSPQPPGSCRQSWKLFQESCYYFGTQKATWPEAEAYCWSMNGRLVEIETEAESNYLESQLKVLHDHASTADQNEVSYWLGGNDIETEGVFKWVKSDAPLTYTDWAPGQPDDIGSGEDCMELRGAFQYHWNDLPCNVPHHFICEAPMIENVNIIGK